MQVITGVSSDSTNCIWKHFDQFVKGDLIPTDSESKATGGTERGSETITN